MNTVGPTTKTNAARTMARTMFVLDSHWMPFSMPETAEAMNAAVSTAITPTSRPFPTLPMPATISRPLPICRAPSPSDAAEPKSVAKMARMSMTRPAGPSARRRPINPENAELISCGRPLRNVP